MNDTQNQAAASLLNNGHEIGRSVRDGVIEYYMEDKGGSLYRIVFESETGYNGLTAFDWVTGHHAAACRAWFSPTSFIDEQLSEIEKKISALTRKKEELLSQRMEAGNLLVNCFSGERSLARKR